MAAVGDESGTCDWKFSSTAAPTTGNPTTTDSPTDNPGTTDVPTTTGPGEIWGVQQIELLIQKFKYMT